MVGPAQKTRHEQQIVLKSSPIGQGFLVVKDGSAKVWAQNGLIKKKKWSGPKVVRAKSGQTLSGPKVVRAKWCGPKVVRAKSGLGQKWSLSYYHLS